MFAFSNSKARRFFVVIVLFILLCSSGLGNFHSVYAQADQLPAGTGANNAHPLLEERPLQPLTPRLPADDLGNSDAAASGTAVMINVHITSVIRDQTNNYYRLFAAAGYLNGLFSVDILQWLIQYFSNTAEIRYNAELWNDGLVVISPLQAIQFSHYITYDYYNQTYTVTLSETGETFTGLSLDEANTLMRTVNHAIFTTTYSGTNTVYAKMKATLVVPGWFDENTGWTTSTEHPDLRVLPNKGGGGIAGSTYYVGGTYPFTFTTCNIGALTAPNGYFTLTTSSTDVTITGSYSTHIVPPNGLWDRYGKLTPATYQIYEWNVAALGNSSCVYVSGNIVPTKAGSYWIMSRMTLNAPYNSAASSTYVGQFSSSVSSLDQQGWYSQTENFTVSKSSSTTTITSDSPDPSVVGQAYSVSVTVSGSYGTPTGSVSVSDGTNTCSIGSLSSSSGSCNLTSTSVGSKTLTATYSGNNAYNSSSGTTSHTVNKASSTTIITSDSPDPSAVGQAYTVSVTVSGSYGTPTGSVSVSDGTNTCSIGSLSSSSGSCNLTSTSVGSKTLTASYSGNTTYNASSGTASHTVSNASSTTTITGDSPDPSIVNQSYTVSVTVSGSYGTPTGSVSVTDGTNNCYISSLTNGSGSCSLTSTSNGSKTITASYSGDGVYNPSSGTTSHTVNKASTQTTVFLISPEPSLVNQVYSVTVSVSSTYGNPTGTVTVSDGQGGSCSAAVSPSMSTCNLTTTTSGSKTITATYGGDNVYNSSSGTAGHTVNKASSTTVITGDSPDPSLVNQSYTVYVTVSGSYSIPSGSVSVSDGTNTCSISSLSGGSGSCSLTSTSVGSKTLTATYSGDPGYNSSSGTTSHTVNPITGQTSTTTITGDSPDPSVVNQSYAVSVTVSGSYGTPTGSVSVSDGSGASCSIASLTNGSGSCNITSTTSGSKTLTATYSGNTAYNASSGTASHLVNKASSTTSITGDSPDPSSINSAYTVSVTVSGSYGTPTGSVSVSDGTNSCSISALSNGSGSCNLTSTTSGSKTLVASYSGNTVYNTSSGTTSHTVNKAASTTTITSDSPDPSLVNQSYTVSVTVTGSYGYPTGSVSVSDGANTCSISALSNGSGSCILTSTASGAKTLTASYSGNTTYDISSGTTSHTVNKASSTTSITGDSPDPSLVNQAYTVSVTVSGSYGTPTGSVSVSDGTNTCSISALSSGSGSCSLTSTTAGSKTLTASYSGNTTYNTSSGTASHVVNAITGQTSTTTITGDSPDPSFVNQSYTVSVTVSGSYGTPTGSVSVSDGANTCSISALSSGSGACNLTSTSAGSKTLTATYSGNATYSGSTGTTSHTANKASSTTSITSDSPDPSLMNQVYTVSVTVSGSYGTPTGSVSVSDGDGAFCSIASLTSGSGSCNLISTSTGAKTIMASYSGNTTYNASSGMADHTVGSLNLALQANGGVATSNSYGCYDSFCATANYANDGNYDGVGLPRSFWAVPAQDIPAWLQIKLAQPSLIYEIKVTPFVRSMVYSLDGSLDGTHWFNIVPAGGYYSSTAPMTFDFAQVRVQYVRMDVTASDAPGTYAWATETSEVEIYGVFSTVIYLPVIVR